MLTKGYRITDLDLEVLKAFFNSTSDREGAATLHMSHHAFRYHVAKIYTVTGLNPRRPADMMELYEGYLK